MKFLKMTEHKRTKYYIIMFFCLLKKTSTHAFMSKEDL